MQMLKGDFSRKGPQAHRKTVDGRRSSFAPLRLCVSTLLLIFTLSGVSAISSQTKRTTQFDPDGSFWVVGTPPDNFLELSAINLNAKKLRRLPSPGLQITDGTNYRFKLLSVKRNRFTFTTVSRDNVSYSFSGRFLRGGVYAATELNDERPVLEGVLTRYRAGKKDAEAKLQFHYFGGT